MGGWDAEAHALVTAEFEAEFGRVTSVDAAVVANVRLCAALRAVMVDAHAQRDQRAQEKEAELRPELEVRLCAACVRKAGTRYMHARAACCSSGRRCERGGCGVQARTKQVESMAALLGQKDGVVADKQRQIESLLEALGARPAASGDGANSGGQRVALDQLKEKMREEALKLQELHESHRKVLEEVRRACCHATLSRCRRALKAVELVLSVRVCCSNCTRRARSC